MDTNRFNEHEIVWSDEHVSRLWNYYSRIPASSDIYFSHRFGKKILIRSNLPLSEEIDILDFGCGPGFMWDHIQALGAKWNYTGIDFSLNSVKSIRDRASHIKSFRGAHHVERLPSNLPNASVDVILLIEVIEHLSDTYLNEALTDIFRLLKKGGIVVITTPNNENLSLSKKFCPECGSIFHEWQHVRSWNIHSLTSYISSHGLCLTQYTTTDFRTVGFDMNSIAHKIKSLGGSFLAHKMSPLIFLRSFKNPRD